MRTAAPIIGMAVVTGALDALWITWLGAGLFEGIAHLRADSVNPIAAALFYVMYLAATYFFAVRGVGSPAEAARRGAALGFVAYGTFELTSWAVLRDWPVGVVVGDILWGALLTATTAAVGALIAGRAQPSRRETA